MKKSRSPRSRPSAKAARIDPGGRTPSGEHKNAVAASQPALATGPDDATTTRQPGRPQGSTEDRRARALDAALACYVRRGIAATSLRDIAREAGITPALLHYYFNDAAGLRDAVIAEHLMPVFAGVRQTLLTNADAPLRQLLRAFVDRVCDTIRARPWLPPLWIREVVSEGGSLRELLVSRGIPDLANFMRLRFEQEQAAGRLSPALDPRLLMVSLIGLTMFPAAGTPIWRQLFQSDDLDIEDIRRHALALIEHGLELRA